MIPTESSLKNLVIATVTKVPIITIFVIPVFNSSTNPSRMVTIQAKPKNIIKYKMIPEACPNVGTQPKTKPAKKAMKFNPINILFTLSFAKSRIELL